MNFIKFHVHMAKEGQEQEEAIVSCYQAYMYMYIHENIKEPQLPRLRTALRPRY